MEVRIALKLTFALVGLIVLLLGAEAILRGMREAAVYEQEIRQEQRVLGRALEQSAEMTWQERGLGYAETLLEAAGAREGEVAVRVLDASEALAAATGPEERDAWSADGTIQASEPGALRTYLRIDGPDGATRALELSTSLRKEGAYVREALFDFAVVAVFLLGLSAAGALWLGRSLVGTRVDSLVGHARQIGTGDFSVRDDLPGSDELASLSVALNDMARALSAAHVALEEETRARFAVTAHLRRSDRLATVGTLAAGLAHELGTPLHVISGRAAMLMEDAGTDPDAKTHANAIADQSQRVQRIIQELLDFARPRRAERRPVDIDALLETDTELLAPILRRRGVECRIERKEVPGEERRPESMAPKVFADPDQLRQVFTNLLLNASQAMKGGGTIEVEIVAERRAPPELRAAVGDAVEGQRFTQVAVRDHGAGIEPEALSQLFDPFFTTKEVGEGTGLGLAVAHGIISDHEGWIAAESEPGQGSTFFVWLPEVHSGDSRPGDARAAESRPAESWPAESWPSQSGTSHRVGEENA